MADFSQNIQNFQRYGTYTYMFDNVGNMTFNSSSANFSQVYLGFPLQNILYNETKVDSFYNPTFTEFIPTPVTSETSSVDVAAIQDQLVTLQAENDSLTTQLNELVVQNEASGSASDSLATKQVILELRKAVGQGRVDSDFSEDFPYMPIVKPTA